MQQADDQDHLETDDAPRGREPVFNLPAIVILIVVACVGIHLLRDLVLTDRQDFGLILRAAFIPLRYSGEFELDVWAFVSPVSYSFLHAGYAHLLVNMIWLLAFGSPLANRLGPVRFVAFWIATTLAAVLLHYVLHAGEPIPLVGASGAISGMMGAAARFGFRIDRAARHSAFSGPVLTIGQALSSRIVLSFLGVWMLVNLIAGFGYLTPDIAGSIAWEAHLGGFLAGFLLIRMFDPMDRW